MLGKPGNQELFQVSWQAGEVSGGNEEVEPLNDFFIIFLFR